MYSKTQDDSLPLVGFRMAIKDPCYNPNERLDMRLFFEKEIGRDPKIVEHLPDYECSDQNGHQIDTRYQKIENFNISRQRLE